MARSWRNWILENIHVRCWNDSAVFSKILYYLIILKLRLVKSRYCVLREHLFYPGIRKWTPEHFWLDKTPISVLICPFMSLNITLPLHQWHRYYVLWEHLFYPGIRKWTPEHFWLDKTPISALICPFMSLNITLPLHQWQHWMCIVYLIESVPTSLNPKDKYLLCKHIYTRVKI